MEIIDPQAIERKSMEIISEIIGQLDCSPGEEKIIKRVIHATADPEFAELVVISPQAIEQALNLFSQEINIVTDVNMLKAGISKKKLKELDMDINCFIAHREIIEQAQQEGITRSMMSMRKAVENPQNKIFVIGNAPTALFELIRLIQEGKAEQVELIIGTPVGFVGASEAKEELKKLALPHITVTGRRGGSAVAASITNALLYMT
ncbi:MAG: precorrin-8X methylmutase [Halanaerobiaceae bacterium]